MLMMAPFTPASIMCRACWRTQLNVPITETSNATRHCAEVLPRIVPRLAPLATLKATSILPNFCLATSIISLT